MIVPFAEANTRCFCPNAPRRLCSRGSYPRALIDAAEVLQLVYIVGPNRLAVMLIRGIGASNIRLSPLTPQRAA